MRLIVLSLMAGLCLVLSGLAANPPANPPVKAPVKPELAAQTAAEEWLVLVDTGKYAESWDKLAPAFKKEVKKKAWKSAIEEIRKPLKGVTSRKLNGAEFTKDLPGAPEGDYVVLKFDTSFEGKPATTETVTMMREGDLVWRAAGYNVK